MLGRDEDVDAVAVVAYSQTREPMRAHVRRPARAGRARAGRPAAARRRPRRPRRRLPAEHPGDARRVPRDREPRRDLGDLPAGVRRPQRPRPARPARAEGAARRRRLPLRREARRPPRAGGRDPRRAAEPRDRRPRPVRRRRRRRAPGRRLLGRSSSPSSEPLAFEPLPFAHPLYVLFSSGTTGLPKAIVHCHGGILLEHLKNHGFSWDLQPGDRLQWFTTTAWMMWNALVSALLLRASIVMIDGNPGVPRPLLPVAARRGDEADLLRPEPRVHDGVPQGGPRAGTPLRPLLGPHGLRGGLAAAARGLRVALRAVRAGRQRQRRQRRHRRLHGDRAGLPAASGVRGRDVRRACSASTRTRSGRTASRSSASSASS